MKNTKLRQHPLQRAGRRVLTGILCTVLLTGTAAGGLTGCARKKQAVTLTFKVPTLAMNCVTRPDVKEAYDIFEEATKDFAAQYKDADVTFRLIKFDLAEEKEYIPDTFDTADAPDLLYEDFFNMGTHIYTGRVIPLDDVIDDRLRADVLPAYWDMSKADGRTYMLPFLARQNVLGYHRSMLRAAGLDRFVRDDEAVASWSLAEWEEVLSGLREKLPENCYALSMYAANEQSDTHTMTWLRSHGSSFFDADGNFHLNTPEGIAALRWLKDNYDKGYYPPNCENLVARDCGKLFWNNQLAIKLLNGPSEDANDPDVGLVNFPSLDGKGTATAFVTGFEIFDNGDAAKIRAAKDFLRFFYGTEKYLDYSAGNMPVYSSVAEKYESAIYRLKAFQDNAGQVVDFMHNNPNWRGVRSVFYPNIQDLLTGARTPEEVAEHLDAECNAAIEEGRRNGRLHA